MRKEKNMCMDKIACIKNIQADLYALGIEPGDTLLIHSSYKAMEITEGGADTFFEAVLSYLEQNGTLVMPVLSFVAVTAENPHLMYFKLHPVFDICQDIFARV